MAKNSFQDTLVASAAELGFGPEAFRPLNGAEAAIAAATVKQTFGDAANGAMLAWWHSDRPCLLPAESHFFYSGGGGWQHLDAIAPAKESLVWLLAQNWGREEPSLIAFESAADVVQAVLGNTHGFEYVVCDRQLGWLFAENHHCCVTVAGAEAVERFRRIKSAESVVPPMRDIA